MQIHDKLQQLAKELGFQQIGVTTPAVLTTASERLQQWLAAGYHGEMDYMQRHAHLRDNPNELFPGIKSIIVVRMDYLPPNANIAKTLQDKAKAYVSRYAVGRDYHKLIRKRLKLLAERLQMDVGEFSFRGFADSAPVFEKPLAEAAGLGWIGKSTNLINNKAGSWFFLGSLYTDLELPVTSNASNHCGSCRACLDVCPTNAFVGPYQLDASRCVSYLTIELRGSIPEEMRPLIGNRVYGCDDCQLVCPWNKFAKFTGETDFHPRHQLDNSDLITLFNWTESEFYKNTEGSAIRRIGYDCWLRNLAVGLGNAPYSAAIIKTLQDRLAQQPSDLVSEHVQWAISQQEQKRDPS